MIVSSNVRLLARLFVIVLALAVPRTAIAQGSADVVVEWNRILVAALSVPGAHQRRSFRLALTQ
jgi:hypothetical protein